MICVECGLCGQEIYADSFEAMYAKMQWYPKVSEVQEANIVTGKQIARAHV